MAKAWQEAGFASEYAYRKAREQSREWSTQHTRGPNSEWRPGLKGKDFRAYFNAYSSKATGNTVKRERGEKGTGKPSRYVKHYVVNVAHAMTAEEFDELYSDVE